MGRGKQVLAAADDTEGPTPSVSAIPASSPSRPLERNIRDEAYLAAPLVSLSRATSPANSSVRGSGSPSRQRRQLSSTPIPQALPALPKFRGTAWDSLSSSPEYRRAESSTYYTTAWGSPYATPSPRRPSWTQSQVAEPGHHSGDTSPVSTRSGLHQVSSADTPDLRHPSASSPIARRVYPSVGRATARDIPGRQGGKSIRDFTEDWINQYLSGQPRTERTNWLSDDSGSETPSFFTARNQFVDEDGWLGLDDDSREEDPLKTPTVADYVARRARVNNAEVGLLPPRAKHISRKSTDTLKQEDFWGFAYDKDPVPSKMSDHQDRQLSVEENAAKPLSPVEKPLPPPPPAETPLGDSSTPKISSGDVSPVKAAKASSTARPKKRVVWRGKACIIAVPLEDKRGSEESGYRLLTRADVEARLKKFQDEGYDTRGFSICMPEESFAPSEEGALSRPLHPDPAEMKKEWDAHNFHVSFPDQSVWDEYVNFLKEEKLRALGVSLGDDEPQQTISPASGSMSHLPGQLPGLISSPPVPTGSANSNQFFAGHPFSPHFNQSANLGSIASPAFYGGDQNLPSGFPFQFTPPIQGTFTPQSFLNARQTGVSPTVPSNLPNLNSILSPVSPLNADDSNAFHPGLHDIVSPHNEFRQDGHGDLHSQPPRQLQTPSEKNEPESFQSHVEIAHPTPRGHGHNVSETLQKGLDRYAQADYHLEESIQRQLEEDDRESNQQHQFGANDLLNSRWALPDKIPQSSQFPRQGSLSQQHHLFGEHYQEETGRDASDIDTNPSVSGTPRVQSHSANQPSWHKPRQSNSSFAPGHKPRTSLSNFNVEAKEFDPSGSFSSSNFQFQGNSFQPSGFDSTGIFSPNSIFKPASSAGSFNVEASPFSPFTGQNSFSGPNSFSGFQFSPAAFNVDAPVFNPGNAVNPIVPSSEPPAGGKSKIFGDIDFTQISKPAKKSKAIPIVRPDEHGSDTKENENENDKEKAREETGRQKRARRTDDDGDKEVELAAPLSEAAQRQSPQVPSTSHAPAEGKENAIPGAEEKVTLDTKIDIVPSEEKPVESKETPVSEAETWTPFEFKNEADAAAFNAAGPDAPGKVGVEKQESNGVVEREASQFPAAENGESVAPKEEIPPPRQESSYNNAKRPLRSKPFEFRPSIAEFIPSKFVLPKSDAEPAPKKAAGLMASRYAVISPPASPEVGAKEPETPKPTTTVTAEPVSKESPKPADQTAEPGEAHDSPDEEELNAVMEQLNGDDSDVGIERQITPRPPLETIPSPVEPTTEPSLPPVNIIRSEAPSPSPKAPRQIRDIPKRGSDVGVKSPAALSASGFASHANSSVRQALSVNDEELSDWNDVLSSGEDEKLANRSRFFDSRVDDIVGTALDERLGPLEQTLSVIQQSVASLASRSGSRRPLRSTSAEIEHSDADDEDDEEAETRSRSPLDIRDRKMEKLKNAVLDALVAHQSSRPEPAATAVDFSFLQESIAELKSIAASRQPAAETENLRETVQAVIAEQLSIRDARRSDADEYDAESLKLQVDGLKSMLRIADERADQQHKAYRESQDSLAEVQRLLKFAEEDAARHRDSALAAEESLRVFKEERIPHFEWIQKRSDALQEQQESLQLTLSELSAKNIALEGTLDEYRLSSDQWRHQIEEVKAENKDLRATINHLKSRIEDSLRARQSLRTKFDRLQDDMTTATRDIVREQAAWRKREEDHIAKYNALRASYDREVKLREKLEIDISELEQQEREAAKLKFIFAQSQHENARLEELISALRLENNELQSKAVRFEREFNEARESSRAEVQRTRTSMEADIEAANNQVNYVRAELEAQISRVQNELENVRMDADTTKERYELLLEEAKDAREAALAAALESKETALEEQRKLHERVLNDLRERHARALHNASEDKQRNEEHMLEKLSLSDEKVEHYKDRVAHLEEKLEIAKSAARAAAQAAQAKGAPISSPPQPTSPSMSFRRDSVPEKISPQALRESILVLQDQLQQREGRIEDLEQELSTVDKEAPNKIKEKDTEINWLRELLGVRIDDLQDIINTLSQPSFDQNAVRDAAIRLKANLQMEQQEKERAMAGGQTFPSLSSISNLAASPRALPLAAAAAWGSWRKARDANLSEQTPSKSSSAGGFLSGLLTPPSSNVRQSPINGSAPSMMQGARRSYSESRPLRSYNSNKTLRSASARHSESPSRLEPPTTPPLLRRSSYDHDAEPNNYENGTFGDDLESTMGGLVSQSPRSVEGPFGPQIVS
ncbi:hypothetical protein DTO021C3_1305 [Paecilomyces variotii]|nr:hypothetical protein DTO021C3_1305 [Paecilomyces variotii]